MLLKHTAHGNAAWVRDMPVIDPGGSANLLVGAALLRGTTLNHSGLIRGTGALVDFVGVLDEAAASADFGTIAAGTLLRRKVIVEPDAVFLAEWDQTSIVSNDVQSATTSAVTYTTSQTDDFDGGYIYVVSGTGLGQLRNIGAATTTVMTVATGKTFTTALDATSDTAMIAGPGTALNDVITAATKLKASNGSGGAFTGRCVVLANWIKTDAISLTEMIPASHGNLDSLNGVNPQFFAEIVFTDTEFHKID